VHFAVETDKVYMTTPAMGNLGDGEIIIIGASERSDSWDLK